MVIVDSSVWIDYFRGVSNPETHWLDRCAGIEPLGMTDLILYEVRQGIVDEESFLRVQAELAHLDVFSAGGSKLAVSAARNYRSLRRKGSTVRKTIDCLIATFCIESGFELLHRDRDFDPFAEHLGLGVVRV